MRIGDRFRLKSVNGIISEIRVLLFDEYEVFYDTKANSPDWFLNRKKTYIFPRINRAYFDEHSEKIIDQDLTNEDSIYMYTYLPLRLLRNEKGKWCSVKKREQIQDFVLKINQIYLHPYGKKGALLKPVLLTSNDKQGFIESELVEKIGEIQTDHFEAFFGTGIYRSGAKSGVPSYYIGGFHDRAGNTRGSVQKV